MTEKTLETVREIMLAGFFIAGAIAFKVYGEETLAATCLGGALAFATPAVARRMAGHAAKAIPLALGLACAACLSGCTGGQLAAAGTAAHAVARVTCGAAQRLARACEATGLAPHEPCPMALQAVGDEIEIVPVVNVAP